MASCTHRIRGGWPRTCLILHLIAAIVAASILTSSAISPTPPAAPSKEQDTASVLQLLAGELEDGDSAAAAAYPSQSASLPFAAEAPTPAPSSSAAAPLSHHRSSSNATFRFSHVLQFHIPQPWDSINMSQIIKDNLEPDLQWWRLSPYEPLVEDLFITARNHTEFSQPLASVRQLVEIFNNTLRFPLMPREQQYTCDYWCDPQLAAFVQAMHDAVHMYNLTLPNVLFLINTADAPICNQDMVANRDCRAPVISLSKQPHIADLIGPVMKAEDASVVHRSWPWEHKEEKAFFRGVPSCGEMTFEPHLCARTWVARLASTNYSHLLDAGLVEKYGSPDQMRGDAVLREGGPLPVLPRVHMKELPKFKWLLNLDGHVAAYRLAQLLATNSLVLKQQSFFSEFYYKSLRPYHHYVPVFKHSQHDLIPKLAWAASHDDLARRITRNANHFALTYTTYRARVLYWRYLLMGYSRLVPDMAEYFEKRAAEQPVDMATLLKRQWAALQAGQQQQQRDGASGEGDAGGQTAGAAGDGSSASDGDGGAAGAGADAASLQLAALAGDDGGGGSDGGGLAASEQTEAELMAQLSGSFK